MRKFSIPDETTPTSTQQAILRFGCGLHRTPRCTRHYSRRPEPRRYVCCQGDRFPLSISDLCYNVLFRLTRRCDCPFTDALILSFFQNVNPHYGMIHKTDFGREYNRWWKKRSRNEPLPIPWTCLLLMMCACACQHLPVDIQKKLAKMLGNNCQECTESFHYSARYLYSAMPPGHYHKNNVLWLLHSTYWYKAEAMFVEACHMFYTAVREAQELGMLFT